MGVCHYSATGAGGTHPVPSGGRRLDLRFTVDWGDQDVRGSHEKPLVFCSFGCLSRWAAEKAEQHDGAAIQDGAA